MIRNTTKTNGAITVMGAMEAMFPLSIGGETLCCSNGV